MKNYEELRLEIMYVGEDVLMASGSNEVGVNFDEFGIEGGNGL